MKGLTLSKVFMKKRNKEELQDFLKKNKRKIKEVYLLGAMIGLYSCGGGGGGSGGGGGGRSDADLSSGDDVRDFSGTGESQILDGMDGRDNIKTGSESDVLRGGLDKDELRTGAGDDVILLVGETESAEYSEEDVEEMLKLILSVDGEDSLNDRKQSEATKGETIDGGAGNDALVIYGAVDLRDVIVRNVEEIRLHSELRLTEKQLQGFRVVKGDGESKVFVESSSVAGDKDVEYDVEDLEELSGIEMLEIGVGVKLIVSSREGLELLGNVGRVGGAGQIEYKDILDGDGNVELTALDLARLGKETFVEEFIDSEQIIVEASQDEFLDAFFEKTVEHVFVLKEGERVVDLRGVSLNAGTSVVSDESDAGFSIGLDGLVSDAVRDYEEDGAKSFILTLTDGTNSFRVKVLLVDVNEASVFSGDMQGTITESEDESIVGSLLVEDEDGESDEYLFSGDIDGEYGVLNVEKDGSWEYELNKEDFRVANLLEGEHLTDSFEVMSVGGTREDVIIRIEGHGTAETEEVFVPRISIELKGEGFVGEELKIEIMGADLPLLETESYSFAWYRSEEGEDGVVEEVISGQTGQMYTLKVEDLGKTITGKLILGRFETETEEGISVFQKQFTHTLSIEGVQTEGEILTAMVGDITLLTDGNVVFEAEDFDYEYYWYREEERLEGEEGESYELKKEDGGKTIKVGVLISYKGDNEAYKDYQSYVEIESGTIGYSDSALEGELSLRGEGVEGETLFVNIDGLNDEDGLEDASYVYQWYRGDVAIEGAVYRSYLLGQEDVGGSISVKVTVSDDEGHVGSVSVAVDQLIENVDNPVLGRVKIIGTVHRQETITANIEGLSDLDGLKLDSFEYQWYRDGEEIVDGTGQELSIEDDWLGSTISVGVSFMDMLGNEYSSKSFDREVYDVRIPKIPVTSLEVNEGVTGSIGVLDTDFRGRGELIYTVEAAYESIVRVDSAGVLEILVAQDYETRDSFNVLITVSSEIGLSSSEQISISVLNVDDESPTNIRLLDSGSNVLSVYQAEEGRVSTIGILTADDLDTAGDSLTYSTNDSRFTIEETAVGSNIYELKSSASLDFEGLEVMNGTAVVIVTVNDGHRDTIEPLTITVLDLDDAYPSGIGLADSSGIALPNIVAVESRDSALGTLMAMDEDTEATNLTYTIEDTRFMIEETGAGSGRYVLKATDLLDYEDSALVSAGTTILEITVNDTGDNATVERLIITVTDRDDETPTDLAILSQNSVREEMVETVGTLTANDVDTAQSDLMFSVDEVNGEFTIERMVSGATAYYVLKSKSSLDYEDVDLVSADGTTMVSITVSDGDREFVDDFEVTIRDVNDNEPVMLLNNFVTEAIDEKLTGESVIGTVSVDDDDRTVANRTINYEVSSTHFRVEKVSDNIGHVYFSPFEISGVDLEVSALITATDGENPVSLSFTVTIDNSDDSQDVQISDQSLRVDEGVLSLPQAVTATGVNKVYSVSSSSAFNIDATTGVLSFKVAANYENSSEREYAVVVTVTGGTNNSVDSATISVFVDDVNDNAPTGLEVLDSGGVDVGNIEVEEGAIEVLGTLKGIDIDTVGTLTYTVANTETRFAINEVRDATGTYYTLNSRDTLDYEGSGVSVDGTTIVEITVNDGLNSVYVGDVIVTIGDVDDESPSNLRLVDNLGDDIANPVGEENGDVLVGTLKADDLDTGGDDLTYTMDGSDVRFVIVKVGRVYELRTRAGLDYEDDTQVTGETTRVEFTVEDTGGNVYKEFLAITVMDRDDESPHNLRLETDTGQRITNIRAEESKVSVLGILKADDLDTADGSLIYSTEDLRFSVELEGGNYVLKTRESLDYEDTALVQGGTTQVEITVNDGGNNSIVESLRVIVEDVDDESPSMIRLVDGSGRDLASYVAFESMDSVLGTLAADDLDTAVEDLSYSLADERFSIVETGVGTERYVLRTNERLDFEDVRLVSGGTTLVAITVEDGGDNVVVEELRITVNDRNDEAPENLMILSQLGVREGEVGTIGTLSATDADTREEDLIFSVDEADGEFTIEKMGSGAMSYYVLKSKSSLDYEDVDLISDDGTTMVTVTVNDGAVLVSKVFEIMVTDVNDNPPVIIESGMVDVPISEALTSATIVGTIRVEDADRTAANKMIVYTISNSKFSIDEGTGHVYFSPFEISGTDLEVSTLITADDGGGEPASISLTVTIDNTDDSQDVAISDQNLRVDEGVGVLPQAVTATGENVTFLVDAGADFEIDSATGVLSFKVVPDYEDANQRSYAVVVTVRSGTSSGSATISIEVEDVNDNAPTGLEVLDGVGNVLGNLMVDEGTMGVIGTLKGLDLDTVGDLTYTIEGTEMRFSIEEHTSSSGGYYTLNSRDILDYESPLVSADGTTTLTVTIDDGVNEMASVELRITIGDVDDEEPSNLRLVDNAGDEILEPVGEENGDNLIGTLMVDDVDTDISSLMYGSNDRRFSLRKTGNVYELRTTEELDYEDVEVVNGTVSVEITVTDGGNNSLVESLVITVLDRDDEMPEHIRMLDEVRQLVTDVVAEESDGWVIGTFTAEDEDTAAGDLVFSTDDLRFRVDLEGGNYVLKATEDLDFEDSVSVVNATAVLLVTVSDGVNPATSESLEVRVLDIDDEDPNMIRLTSAGTPVLDIVGTEGGVVLLGTLVADDEDTAVEDLSYVVNDDRFSIEKVSGATSYYVLSTTAMLDYEGAGVVNGITMVEITVTDGGTNSAVESLTVTVADIDDETPSGLTILGQSNVREGMVEVVGTLSATDVDTDDEDLIYTTDEVNGEFTIERVIDGANTYYLLKTKSSLDYEDTSLVSADGTALVTVIVSDGAREFERIFEISVVDENDHRPMITQSGFVSTPIDEEIVGATVIGSVIVVDDDRTAVNKALSYSVSNNQFSVDGSTGDVYFTVFEISGDDLEVMATITVSDGVTEAVTLPFSVTIR